MSDRPPSDIEALLRRLYAAFNRQDVEVVLAALHEDVDWPNVIEGVRLHGREAVRAYWSRQFATIDPRVEPEDVAVEPDGRVVVRVHQVVRGLDGTLLDDRMVRHVYTLDAGLVRRMDVVDD